MIVVLAVHADKVLSKVEGKNSSSRPRLMLLGPTGVCASLIGNYYDKYIKWTFKKLTFLLIIGGTTIHTGLDINFGSTYKELSEERLNNVVRPLLKDLEVIIIDELSMVSCDMLYNIHQRLCTIFHSRDNFGGKTVLLVGDIMQLKPPTGRFIFEEPSVKNTKYDLKQKIDPLWQSFEVVILERNE